MKAPFLFGISTAAHHIEGNDSHSDWWHRERELTGGVSSGEACNSYKEYKRDRKILQNLGCNSYRFSIEWSRIEPKEGKFSKKAVAHYIDVIDDLKIHGIEPVLTLHHFTNPEWFESSGGWERADAAQVFFRFVSYLLTQLKGKVKLFTPINEPNVYTSNKYLGGVWFPGKKNPLIAWNVIKHLAEAHKYCYKLIKETVPDSQVGSCVQSVDIVGLPNMWWPINLMVAGVGAFIYNHLFYLLIGGEMDFVGLNFYSTYKIGFSGIIPKAIITPHPLTEGKLVMKSEPQRLLSHLRAASRYGKPIMITENGKLSPNDSERRNYLVSIFNIMRKAIEENIPLFGYQHFTHLDSFEWSFAFAPQFGLYSHNPRTHRVTAKPSAKTFAKLVKSFHHWNQYHSEATM